VNTGDARTEILRSIRAHLAMSAPSDLSDPSVRASLCSSVAELAEVSLVQLFKQNLELVDGHCIIVNNEAEVEEAVKRIAKGREIATPDALPATKDLFKYDVGVTKVQAAIADTGTLVLDSAAEKNRLLSLVPPIHIAILDASRIYSTLGETLSALQSGEEVSPAITFITGPSRTADIELTLAIGVHGPQDLYVIINQNA
jgi:L-lactate utilization protein LutC